MNRLKARSVMTGTVLLAASLALIASRLSANTNAHSSAVPQADSAKEGRAMDEAVGYSKTFSFDEAFKDAIKNLPKHTPSHPDEMTRITVVEIGAELGGIAGLHRLAVHIKASTD